ncbi:MAG: hypothetical protein ACXADB_10525, partial [Candidatus Hermodarchaeia archaeon]
SVEPVGLLETLDQLVVLPLLEDVPLHVLRRLEVPRGDGEPARDGEVGVPGDGLDGSEADAPGVLLVADLLAAAGASFEAHMGRPGLHIADRRLVEGVLVGTATVLEEADEASDVTDVDLHAAFGPAGVEPGFDESG